MKQYIEIVGPPGSGKSTLMRLLSDQLNRKNIENSQLYKEYDLILLKKIKSPTLRGFLSILPTRVSRKILRSLKVLKGERSITTMDFLIKYPNFCKVVIDSVFIQDKDIRKIYILDIIEKMDHRITVEEKKPNKLILDTEGLLNRVILPLSYYKKSFTEKDVIDRISSIPSPSMIIMVNTKVKVCKARMEKREDIPKLIRHFSAKEILEGIGNHKRVMKILKMYFKKRGVPVIEIENNSHPKEVMEKLNLKLRKFINVKNQ